MKSYDVFNGDADGICALVQLRLAEPRTAQLVTGVKRDINLLAQVNGQAGDHITALDISMRTNAEGLRRNLNSGAHVFYVDHHNPGDIPKHENLFAVIDTRPNICTSLLVNKFLNGAYQNWAIVGAWGDNILEKAKRLCINNTTVGDMAGRLKVFGFYLNYNAYGRSVEDLHFRPDELFQILLNFKDPVDCLNEYPELFQKLGEGYSADIEKAKKTGFHSQGVIILEDAPWARRISGSYGNILTDWYPDQAYAILTHNTGGGYTVSVRAPQENPNGADILCLKFPTGGGRAAAAGINHLPKDDLDKFLDAFRKGF